MAGMTRDMPNDKNQEETWSGVANKGDQGAMLHLGDERPLHRRGMKVSGGRDNATIHQPHLRSRTGENQSAPTVTRRRLSCRGRSLHWLLNRSCSTPAVAKT